MHVLFASAHYETSSLQGSYFDTVIGSYVKKDSSMYSDTASHLFNAFGTTYLLIPIKVIFTFNEGSVFMYSVIDEWSGHQDLDWVVLINLSASNVFSAIHHQVRMMMQL